MSGVLDIVDKAGLGSTGFGIVSSILGFNDLILDTFENVVEQFELTREIMNDSGMTSDEKEYMLDKIDDLTNIEAGFDAAGWAVGTIFGPAGSLISHVGDAINSDGVRAELLEGYQEKREARERLDNADTLIEKVGAQLNVWGEEIESVVEVGREVVCEFVEDVVSDSVEVVNNVIVEPVKQGLSWFGRVTGWW